MSDLFAAQSPNLPPDGLLPQKPGESCDLKWLFLDLNSYFASVEQQDRPYLRGRPIAVVPMETDSTCAIAASYEAKAYGIKTGTKIYEAKRLCPHLQCVLARHDIYVAYHHKIISAISKHLPINKIWSVDELSSRLPPGRRDEEKAKEISIRTKEQIWKDVGSEINCSIGIAPNAFLAKVATDMQKPDGLVVLRKQDLPGPLFELDLIDLPGINVNMLARLNRAGIRSIEHLWNIPAKQARAIWGSVNGERFWYNLHGYEIPDIATKDSVIGHSRVLDPCLRSPEKARAMARQLTNKACQRLRRKNYHAAAFALSSRTTDGLKWTRDIRISPAQDTLTFLQALDELWGAMLAECRPEKLKKVSISLHKLHRIEEITGNLFDQAPDPAFLQDPAPPCSEKEQNRRLTLSRTIDSLNQKYGSSVVSLGTPPKTTGGYIGTKIAFSRVPESAEFNE